MSGPREEPRPVTRPPPSEWVGGRQGVEAEGVLGDRVRDALGVEQEGVKRQVVDGVPRLVVVGVVGLTGRTAEQRRLFLRLPDLSTRE